MASNDVIVRLVADMGNLQAGMQKAQKEISALKGTTEKASSGISSSFKKIGTVVATAFAVDKLISFGKHMVEVTASVQALDSQFQQTFKGDQDKAMAGITAQAQEQGIHVDRLKGQWASFYGTFRGNGATANQSLELTRKYMHLAGDGAAYYDKSLEDVTGRLKSITMGNFEAGDAIGLNLNVTKLDTIAKQKYGKAWQKLTDTEKEFLVLDTASKIYESSGAMGQGARESQNWENVTGNLKATWERLLSVVGSPVLQGAISVVTSLTEVIQTVTDKVVLFADAYDKASQNGGGFFENLSEALNNIGLEKLGELSSMIGSVVENAQQFVSWFSQMGNGATALAGLIGTLTALFVGFQFWLNAGSIASGIMTTAMTIQATVTGILSTVTTTLGLAVMFLTSPLGIIITIIGAVVTAGVLLYKNWDTVCQYASKLGAWISGVWNSICTWTSNTWNSITTYISNAWNSICAGVSAGITAVENFFVSGWNMVSSACSTAWEFIKNVVTVGIMAVVSIVQALFQLITLPIQFVWENCKGIFISAWEYMKMVVENGARGVYNIVVAIITPIVNFFTTVWNGICTIVTTVWNAISSVTASVWNSIVSTVSGFINSVQAVITSIFNAVSSYISSVWNSIVSTISSVWNSIVSNVTSFINSVKAVITSVFNAVKSYISSVWNSIKSTISSVWSSIVSTVSGFVNSVKSTVTSVWNSIKSTTASVWEGIKNAMWKPIEYAKNKIHDMIQAIKDFFNITLEFPHIKMPHFSIEGKFSLAPPSVPSLNIDWYATGGIATAPSIVGVGEAGDEAILPLSNKGKMKPFAQAVANMMPDNKKSDSYETSGVNIQVGSLVVREEADINRIAEQLYRLQERNRRARGRTY